MPATLAAARTAVLPLPWCLPRSRDKGLGTPCRRYKLTAILAPSATALANSCLLSIVDQAIAWNVTHGLSPPVRPNQCFRNMKRQSHGSNGCDYAHHLIPLSLRILTSALHIFKHNATSVHYTKIQFVVLPALLTYCRTLSSTAH